MTITGPAGSEIDYVDFRRDSAIPEQAQMALAAPSVDSSKVESLVVLDTLKEITTITIDRNDRGDTLRLTQITDRTRATSRDKAKDVEVKIVEKTDTVYIAVRDSVYVSNTNLTNPSEKKSNFVSSLKWIFWLLCAIVALIIGGQGDRSVSRGA